jgi:hypothetical protein
MGFSADAHSTRTLCQMGFLADERFPSNPGPGLLLFREEILWLLFPHRHASKSSGNLLNAAAVTGRYF